MAITYDRYGHLMPGNEAEAAGMLDAYLAVEGRQNAPKHKLGPRVGPDVPG